MAGVALVTPAAPQAGSFNGVRAGHSRRREWLKRGLHRPKLVCPPRLSPPCPGPPRSATPSSLQLADIQVVIAVDPHKASWTAVAVDARLQSLGAVRVPVSKAGYRQLAAIRLCLAAGPLGR
ncbi:hypothetical protein GCM10023178_10460 [Actinomadura luteofluorescens]